MPAAVFSRCSKKHFKHRYAALRALAGLPYSVKGFAKA